MICILLAAGYATRLYPLTENMPKALLTLGSKTILDRVIEKINELECVERIYIVTNHRFAAQFNDWLETAVTDKCIKVIDDNTTNNDNRLGAIGDINFVIEREKIDDELLVMASDNIFDFSLKDMEKIFRTTGCDTIAAHYVEDISLLKQMGVVNLTEASKVTEFVEKPENPPTHWGALPFYFYNKESVRLIKQYLDEGNNPDAPGHLVPYMCTHGDVYAYTFETTAIDIGTPETYADAQKLFD